MPTWLRTLLQMTVIVAIAWGSATITLASVEYFGEELAPFVIEKLPLPLEEVWIYALKAHVLAAAFSLPACLLLMSSAVLRRGPMFHRWLGRLTGVAILLVLFPSGLYLSLFAKGGLAATAGFMLSGFIVAVAMVQGVRTARSRRLVAHRRWMLHVLAQLSVAVTSRAMLFGFDTIGAVGDTAYLLSLWIPVLGSLGVVELMSTRRTAIPSWRTLLAVTSPRAAVRGQTATST